MESVWFRLVSVLVAFLAAFPAAAQPAVTLQSLLGEMADLTRLTRMPDPAYTTGQFSSYDRRSTDPAVATDENWFANRDRGHFLRTEVNAGREEFVLMDAKGPGAIVRFWSASPEEAGVIRVYLDGAPEPVIEMPLVDFLGGKSPLNPPPIGGERARGWNSFLPVPYAAHCKVTAVKPAFFYIINYRTYAAGTPVETFTQEIAASASTAIQQTANQLAKPAEIEVVPAGTLEEAPYTLELSPGATETTQAPAGPAVLLRFEVHVDAVDLETVLRGCLLEVVADGHADAFVQAPLGDFFATVPGPNVYASVPSGVLGDGTLYSRWPMPYRAGLTFRITNHTSETVKIVGRLVADRRPLAEDTLYFHAKWRSERNIVTHPRQDWNFVTIQGRGRYVGTMLHVTNPIKNWWGEGDEKIYVDGDAFPTWFGTGSEDYFGYAWCSEQRFTHAYHNQVYVDGPWNFGQTCVSRFHIMDDIPFAASLQFDMEVWRGIDVIAHQSAVSFWYAAPGATDNVPAPEAAQLTIPEPPPVPTARVVAGAIEGERMKLIGRTGGRVLRQYSDQWDLSGGAHRWWLHGKVGDRIELAFTVGEAGPCEVYARFTRAPDFGIVQLRVNGEAAGGPVDCYSPALTFGPEASLGVFTLESGANAFSATLTGANPEAVPAHMFGLDYLRLAPR